MAKSSTVREWRLSMVAMLVWDVAPRYSKNALTWAQLEEEAVNYYHENKELIQKRSKKFSDYKDTFISVSFIKDNHTAIQIKLAEQGRFLSYAVENGKIKGMVRAYTEEEYRRVFNHNQKIITGMADSNNDLADTTNKQFNTQFSVFDVQPLLAQPTNNDED